MERVSACVRMHHPQYSNEAIERHLDACAENGTIQKVSMHEGDIYSVTLVVWHKVLLT